MLKFDPKRSIHKMMLAVAASLVIGTAIIATGTTAFAHGAGSGGHFGGAASGRFGGGPGGHFLGGGRFAGERFGRGFRGRFVGGFGFGGYYGPYYGYGYGSCYIPTPYGYTWVCD